MSKKSKDATILGQTLEIPYTHALRMIREEANRTGETTHNAALRLIEAARKPSLTS